MANPPLGAEKAAKVGLCFGHNIAVRPSLPGYSGLDSSFERQDITSKRISSAIPGASMFVLKIHTIYCNILLIEVFDVILNLPNMHDALFKFLDPFCA